MIEILLRIIFKLLEYLNKPEPKKTQSEKKIDKKSETKKDETKELVNQMHNVAFEIKEITDLIEQQHAETHRIEREMIEIQRKQIQELQQKLIKNKLDSKNKNKPDR